MRWVAQWEDIPNSEKYNVDGREANLSPCKSGGKEGVAAPPVGTRVSFFECSLLEPNSTYPLTLVADGFFRAGKGCLMHTHHAFFPNKAKFSVYFLTPATAELFGRFLGFRLVSHTCEKTDGAGKRASTN